MLVGIKKKKSFNFFVSCTFPPMYMLTSKDWAHKQAAFFCFWSHFNIWTSESADWGSHIFILLSVSEKVLVLLRFFYCGCQSCCKAPPYYELSHNLTAWPRALNWTGLLLYSHSCPFSRHFWLLPPVSATQVLWTPSQSSAGLLCEIANNCAAIDSNMTKWKRRVPDYWFLLD